jgi:hypothetical protein
MSSQESAFGRPPQWKSALPAAIVGVLACLLALYGRYALPPKLPKTYAQHLQRSTAAYDSVRHISGMFGSAKLVAVAGERDVIFERLASLEHSAPERYWEWYEFLSSHASFLRAQLADPSVSISEKHRQPLSDQADLFESKAQQILEQLSASTSPYKGPSVLQLSRQKYERGYSAGGVVDAASIIQQLEPIVDAQPQQLADDELVEAQWLLIATKIEAAWQQTAGSFLRCDPALLNDAEERLADLLTRNQPTETFNQPRWQALSALLTIYRGGEAIASDQASAAALSRSSLSARGTAATWSNTLAEIQLAACNAHWQDVEYLLPGSTTDDFTRISGGVARTVCRLICSAAAQQDTDRARRWFPGVLLAGRIAPQSPEWMELLWESARQMSDAEAPQSSTAGESQAVVPASVVDLLSQFEDSMMQGSLRVLSASFAGDSDALRLRLDELRTIPGGTLLIARIAVWRCRTLEEEVLQASARQLEQLVQGIVDTEPHSGLNWFALGVLRFRLQDFSEAEQALEKAVELTDGATAVKEALNAVKGTRNRMGNR